MGGLDERRLALFEDRYGSGSHARLLSLLRRPGVSFARIATRFNVSRERVRQWHALWLPDAPTGRERRRAGAAQQRRRRLLADALFAAFVRHVGRDAGGLRVGPVAASSGYRTRLATLDGHLVALRDARASRIGRYHGPADYVYLLLTDHHYLCAPVAALSLNGATSVDQDSSRLRAFTNTFAALPGASALIRRG